MTQSLQELPIKIFCDLPVISSFLSVELSIYIGHSFGFSMSQTLIINFVFLVIIFRRSCLLIINLNEIPATLQRDRDFMTASLNKCIYYFYCY